MSDQPDNELWEKVMRDEPSAFEPLFHQYWEQMFNMAYRRLGDESRAKDIVQDIFIRTWENRREIVVSDSLAPYLMTALKYSIIREIYRSSKKGYMKLPLSVLDIPAEEQGFLSDWQEVEHLQTLVLQEVSAMPLRMQQIFRLRREQELSVRDIALRLSLSEQTVKNTLHTAMKRLRLRLQQPGAFLVFFI
ncbi:RNA polymerase sigma factor [Flavitalea flava]